MNTYSTCFSYFPLTLSDESEMNQHTYKLCYSNLIQESFICSICLVLDYWSTKPECFQKLWILLSVAFLCYSEHKPKGKKCGRSLKVTHKHVSTHTLLIYRSIWGTCQSWKSECLPWHRLKGSRHIREKKEDAFHRQDRSPISFQTILQLFSYVSM